MGLMRTIRAIQARKHRKEIKAAIQNYNAAVRLLQEAAEDLLHIANRSGISTPQFVEAMEQYRAIAGKAMITPEDLQKGGGTGNAKR